MTTALIGKHDIELGCKARVGLVKRQGPSGLAELFARSGHELVECPDWPTLALAAAEAPFDLVLVDADATSLPRTELACPVLPVGDATEDGLAVAPGALEQGLEPIVALAFTLTRLHARTRELERVVDGIRSGSAFVGHSPVSRRMLSAISRAADAEATVLVEGPVGSGKSLAARAIHCKSRRGNRPLIVVDGPAATAESLARQLEEARGTTLLLEDVDRLPAPAQATLVRHLKERASGSSAPPRVIATTAAHLPELVARGAFREDLFYRLHALPITVPALRERLDDLPLLARAILAPPSTRGTPLLTPDATALLERMPWPGNVSQLEATLRRAQYAAGGGTIGTEHLGAAAGACPTTNVPAAPARNTADDEDLTEAAVLPFEQEEQRLLSRALRATKGNVRRAAQLLGIGRATLYRKIQQYHLRLQ